jgi:hypothetical protein
MTAFTAADRGSAGERDVGEDLRGAAQDRRVGIHTGVAGHHADVFRAEVAAQARNFSFTSALIGQV